MIPRVSEFKEGALILPSDDPLSPKISKNDHAASLAHEQGGGRFEYTVNGPQWGNELS